MVTGKARRPGGCDAPDHQRHREGPISPQPATGLQDCPRLSKADRGSVHLRGYLRSSAADPDYEEKDLDGGKSAITKSSNIEPF